MNLLWPKVQVLWELKQNPTSSFALALGPHNDNNMYTYWLTIHFENLFHNVIPYFCWDRTLDDGYCIEKEESDSGQAACTGVNDWLLHPETLPPTWPGPGRFLRVGVRTVSAGVKHGDAVVRTPGQSKIRPGHSLYSYWFHLLVLNVTILSVMFQPVCIGSKLKSSRYLLFDNNKVWTTFLEEQCVTQWQEKDRKKQNGF